MKGFLEVSRDELLLRQLLWKYHGCDSQYLYGDDGELQCSHPKHRSHNLFDFIDFRRDSVRLIEWKLGNNFMKGIIARPEN